MSSARPSAAHASVAFLKIAGFAQSPVAEQARLKSRLEEVIEASIDVFDEQERIVLEAPEGVAVVVLGNPLAAMRFAWRAIAQGRDIPVAAGLTHGPVRVSDAEESLVHGDALAAAEAIAGLARRGDVSASREFRDALGRFAPSQARCLAPAGAVVDSGDRSHELFRADERSCARRRRRFFAFAGGIAVAILALGVVARIALPGEEPGTVVFQIKPAGEIFVNGDPRGTSPPLKSIQLPAGTHAIEIRSARHPPLVTMLTLAPGEQVVVEHAFASPKPSQPAKPLWRRFIDRFK